MSCFETIVQSDLILNLYETPKHQAKLNQCILFIVLAVGFSALVPLMYVTAYLT